MYIIFYHIDQSPLWLIDWVSFFKYIKSLLILSQLEGCVCVKTYHYNMGAKIDHPRACKNRIELLKYHVYENFPKFLYYIYNLWNFNIPRMMFLSSTIGEFNLSQWNCITSIVSVKLNCVCTSKTVTQPHWEKWDSV